MRKSLKAILIIALFLVFFSIIPVIIFDASEFFADVGHYIINLFHRATLNPNHSGFNDFFQLIIIAIFVGWTVHRLKNMRKRK